jgi:hypothetical protein
LELFIYSPNRGETAARDATFIKAHIAASANEKKHAAGLLDKAVAALRLGVPGKARSIATFGW